MIIRRRRPRSQRRAARPVRYERISFLACCTTPGLDRVPGGTKDPDAAGVVPDHGQDVHLRAVEEIGGEEVQRQDPVPPERRILALTWAFAVLRRPARTR
jgi:hypothetical protein